MLLQISAQAVDIIHGDIDLIWDKRWRSRLGFGDMNGGESFEVNEAVDHRLVNMH